MVRDWDRRNASRALGERVYWERALQPMASPPARHLLLRSSLVLLTLALFAWLAFPLPVARLRDELGRHWTDLADRLRRAEAGWVAPPAPLEPEPVGIDRGFIEDPGSFTVGDCLAQYGPAARARLAPFFRAAGQPYPPARIRLVGLKAERSLEVWTSASPGGPLVLVRRYPVLGASGGPGPKLREGDLQVPEGLYPIVSLNPNSAIHLSMRIGYPSAEDAAHARREGRSKLGGDIMIHGGRGSVGCLAIGNTAIEELFTLVAETGVEHTDIVLSPVDFRRRELPLDAPAPPAWMPERYQRIRRILAALGKS